MAARAHLGTATIKDTVNEALRLAAEQDSGWIDEAFDRLAKADLGDREDVWRGLIGRQQICDVEVGYSARNASEWD